MDDGLTKDQIAAFRDMLLDQQKSLREQQRDNAQWSAPVTLDQQSVGRLSRMDAMQQQQMAEAEARRRTYDLARIDAALKRIDEDDYGWCAQCGEAIASKRLEVDPMAHLCVGCAP